MLITRFTRRIESLAAGFNLVYGIAARYYKDVVRKEIDLANINARDSILCIGGGICPFSAILLHQETGADVTVIDNDSACVPKARRVIERLGLCDHVRVIHEDGADADLSAYTVVHFAMQVAPMAQVFDAVEKRAAPGTKLLIRKPKVGLSGLYGRLNCAHCGHTVHSKSSNIGSTLLFIKEGIA